VTEQAPHGTLVAVIQARMGSTRLPGKVLADLGGRPILLWVLESVASVPGVVHVVVATTTDAADDAIVEAIEGRVTVHRGPVRDVLTRVWDAVAPYGPAWVLRQTADNPFADPEVARRQVELAQRLDLDYVGIEGWPMGIAAEVAAAPALREAAEQATHPGEREHVMPYIYRRPDRFRLGRLEPVDDWTHGRYTVDTAEDLVFARALADGLGHGPPAHLSELEGVLARDPGLAAQTRHVTQKDWREAEAAP
jgi:spore coat polysaccharide biosynthesis protein SpsF